MEETVKIISREFVKPSSSSPTLPHLNTLTFSFLGKLFPSGLYGTIVFFYASGGTRGLASSDQYARLLKSSLSHTLARFYPFAGRLSGNTAVDCNDEGACFVEARASFPLDRFIGQPDSLKLNHFIPFNDLETTEQAENCMLIIQLTVFSCGGAAITACPSHKLADASSLHTFLKSWSDTALDRKTSSVAPEFMGNSVIPSGHQLPISPAVIAPVKNCTAVRLVFAGPSISNLKSKCSLGVPGKRPSSVQAVQALILRCAIDASCSTSKMLGLGSSCGPSLVLQMVNLRKRIAPPLPDNSIGNLSWNHPVLLEAESETELPQIAYKLSTGLKDFFREKASKFKGDDAVSVILQSLKERAEVLKSEKATTVYTFTSLRGFPLHEMDFGLGKPIWVTSPSNYRNLCVMLETKSGDGIEAWITLDEQEMAIFECNDELLASASVNPSVVSATNISCRL